MVQALLARSLTENGLPTGRHLDEDRPQRMLALVVDEDQIIRIAIVERVRQRSALSWRFEYRGPEPHIIDVDCIGLGNHGGVADHYAPTLVVR